MIRAHKTRTLCITFLALAIFLSVFSRTMRTITTAAVQIETTKMGVVSLSAVCGDEKKGYYVYHVEEIPSFFGEEIKAVRNSIEILDIKDGLAYVTGIYEGDRIIVTSTRMLQNGNPIVVWDNDSETKLREISTLSNPSKQSAIIELKEGLRKLLMGSLFIWILLWIELRCIKKIHNSPVIYKAIAIVIPFVIVTGLMLMLRFGLIGKNMFPAVWSDPTGWEEIYSIKMEAIKDILFHSSDTNSVDAYWNIDY